MKITDMQSKFHPAAAKAPAEPLDFFVPDRHKRSAGSGELLGPVNGTGADTAAHEAYRTHLFHHLGVRKKR